MPTIKRCAQWCIIGLLVSATDIFYADDSDSDSGLVGCADRFGRDEKTFRFTFAEKTQA
jgi:hypothetical protein